MGRSLDVNRRPPPSPRHRTTLLYFSPFFHQRTAHTAQSAHSRPERTAVPRVFERVGMCPPTDSPACTHITHFRYIMSEVDYVPVLPHFHTHLVRMSESAFGAPNGAPRGGGGRTRRFGALVAVLHGRPVEGLRSKHFLHPQGAQIMHQLSLRRLVHYVYVKKRWRRSVSDTDADRHTDSH